MSQAQVVKLPGSPPSSGRKLSLRDLGLTWERLGVVEVGFGTAAWLRITPSAPGLQVLGRASTTGPADPTGTRALRIGETGQVPEIEVENRGGDPLLLPAHLVLAGGWQTRAVERSVIVPSSTQARVPVKCVEAGRWAPRDERTAGTFEVADRTGMRTRWSATRSMVEQLRFTGRFAAEQSAIWQQVDEDLSRSPVASRTRSYEAYLRWVKQPFIDEAKKAGVRPPPRANAVAILPRGGGYWVEAYPTDGALAEDVDDLLADLFDPAAKGEGAEPALDLDALLADLWDSPLRSLDRVAGTLGEGWAFAANGPGLSNDAMGAALIVEGALAHLGVGAPPAAIHKSEGSPLRKADSGTERRPDPLAAEGSGDRRVGEARPPTGLSYDGAASGPKPRAPTGPIATQLVSGDSGPLERPRVDLETMRAVYGRARDLMPDEPPARERVQGYRLVRVLDRNISWVDVRIGGEGYAVIGSHDRCDLVLSNDSGVWLRHMAAICVRLDDDTVGLRMIDLKTDLPFFLEDDTPRWSVVASGPFAMRLGRHVICGFPIGPLTGDEPVAPQRPIERRDLDPGATGIIETGLIRTPSEGAGGALGSGVSANVVPVRAPNEITAFLPSAPVAQLQDIVAPGPSPLHIRVTLERGGMGASVELPADALDAGILLGRALNCFDGGLRRIFCEAISRAHVLLLRDHGDVFAYDLCSTNGTRVAGQRSAATG
ncbi:MAG: FHA domain-containing protein [Minicystis sp.]